jgi:hypothetical protein
MSLAGEIVKALAAPLVALTLAWIWGNRLSFTWNIRQKRREASLIAVAEFSRLYGEFFATWKVWNHYLQEHPNGEQQEKFFERASTAEAGIESLLVRLAGQARLTEYDIEVAGKFRQAYQQLRGRIKAKKQLDWGHAEHPEYMAFKRLSTAFSQILAEMDAKEAPSNRCAIDNFVRITSNKWEPIWMEPVIVMTKEERNFVLRKSAHLLRRPGERNLL